MASSVVPTIVGAVTGGSGVVGGSDDLLQHHSHSHHDHKGPVRRAISNKFGQAHHHMVVAELTSKCKADRAEIDRHVRHIELLEEIMRANNIAVPPRPPPSADEALRNFTPKSPKGFIGYVGPGELEDLKARIKKITQHIKKHRVTIRFQDLSIVDMVSPATIDTVGSSISKLFGAGGEKREFKILNELTGYVPHNKMTLLLGAPGSGKSSLMKALSGRMHMSGDMKQTGSVTFNNDTVVVGAGSGGGGKFLVPKVVDYVDQEDTHAPTLTVLETFEFAFNATTGGHHAYSVARSRESALLLNKDDALNSKVRNVTTILGLDGCKNVLVGNGMIRGVSGGQKKRVTLGEFMVSPSRIKMLDSVSNGLDAATTYDIMHSTKEIMGLLGFTAIVALLQPPPEVFDLFDDIILMSEGSIIYQGPREQIMKYFDNLGYACPKNVDMADYLQELPTPEGRRYLVKRTETETGTGTGNGGEQQRHRTTAEFVKAWKASDQYQAVLDVVEGRTPDKRKPDVVVPAAAAAADSATRASDEEGIELTMTTTVDNGQYQQAKETEEETGEDDETYTDNWLPEQNSRFAGSLYFYFKLLLKRQLMITLRDKDMLKARMMQTLMTAAILGSLFNNIPTADTQTMIGLLFACSLTPALANMSMIPNVIEQRDVYYKHADASMYPTSMYAFTQTMVLVPWQLIETILSCSITYWSCSLSQDGDGSRFFVFILMTFSFSVCCGQMFRLIASSMPSATAAQPVAGVMTVMLVLFSGFIAPPDQIPSGWIWVYWINPMAWVLRAMVINEFSADDYDEKTCTNFPTCTKFDRFGDVTLDFAGFPVNYVWVWYGLLFLWGLFALFVIGTVLVLKNVRAIESPVPLLPSDDAEENTAAGGSSSSSSGGSIAAAVPTTEEEEGGSAAVTKSDSFKFEEATFAFKDISYSVELPSGEELELLHRVDGFFKPKTLTALMGSSGAGKTTLLDCLAGRKTVGTLKGTMNVNQQPKDDAKFRQIMGYVEQFDALFPFDTAREAVEFSAALRLKSSIGDVERQQWVDNILDMLELTPIQNMMVGTPRTGGMSFEQKKRVCIAIELAANPSILFLDEPTSGLDSRAAQVTIRCLKRAAASGRAIVCTIHQPSHYIFSQFDALLLLKRGGQTVFFGELGDDSEKLVRYFQGLGDHVPRIRFGQNAASWMLEVIGAGTAGGSKGGGGGSGVSSGNARGDFHEQYLQSEQYILNSAGVDVEMYGVDDEEEEEGQDQQDQPANLSRRQRLRFACTSPDDPGCILDRLRSPLEVSKSGHLRSELDHRFGHGEYLSSNSMQARWLFKRSFLAYWRNPDYNLIRMFISLVIALIFGSVFARQVYHTSSEVISRSAVIFLSTLFCGIVGLNTVITVTMASRPAFYREQQSRMYNPLFYEIALGIVEVPYLLASSLIFTIPFFFIVGFDDGYGSGSTITNFMWFWLYEYFYLTSMVFAGQFLGMALPNEAAATVVSGLWGLINSNFCGFIVKAQDLPKFWIFAYWLSPLHYALEGIVMTQFHNDDTNVRLQTGQKISAESFVNLYYEQWSFSHRFGDLVGLVAYAIFFRIGIYLAMRYVRHQTR